MTALDRTPAPTAASGEKTAPGPYVVLAAVSLGVLLAPLNSTMLAVALPSLRDDFHVSASAVGWLVSGYLVAMAVVQPAAGRLGDELGRARVFRAGLVAFLLSSLGAAASPNLPALITFRTLQAVSGAVLLPNAMGMLRAAVPTRQFGKFAGLNGAAIGGSAAAGPLLGGALLGLGSWRLIFLVNVPIVLLALAVAIRLPRQQTSTKGAQADWAGLGLFATLLLALTVSLNQLRASNGLLLAGAILATCVLGAAFAARQRISRAPAAAWSLFRDRGFVGAASHILLMNLAMYTTLLAVPFFITDVQGRDAAVAGLLLSSMAVLQAGSAPVVGRISDAVGRRIPAIASSLLAIVSAAWLAISISAGASLISLVLPVALLGFGVGLGFTSATAAAVESAPMRLAGSAAGTQSMMRYVGSIVGSGALAGLLTVHDGAPAGLSTFRLLFLLVTAVAVLSLFAAVAIRPWPPASYERPEA